MRRFPAMTLGAAVLALSAATELRGAMQAAPDAAPTAVVDETEHEAGHEEPAPKKDGLLVHRPAEDVLSSVDPDRAMATLPDRMM